MGKKKIIAIAAAALLWASFVATPVAAKGKPGKSSNEFKLTILQTNDLHGHVQDITTLEDGSTHYNDVARYATVINEVRSKEENVLLVDGGDLFLRGPFQEFNGELESALLKAMDYDAMTLGNNDFRVFPAGEGDPLSRYVQLKDYQRTFNFPILLSNVTYKETGKYLQTVKPYQNFNFKGIKVGLIGMTSMKPQIRNWNDVADLTFEDPVANLKTILPEVEQKSDVEIVLSHAGHPDDIRMAKEVAGIEAIIGADTHMVLKSPVIIKNEETLVEVPLTMAGGEKENYLGRLDLTFRKINGEYRAVEKSGFLYDVSKVAPDAKISAIIEEFKAKHGLN